MSKAVETPGRLRHARVGMLQARDHDGAIRPADPAAVERAGVAGTGGTGAAVPDSPGVMTIYMAVTVQPLAGYVSTTRTLIAAALAAWVAKGSAGQHACRIHRDDLLAAARLCGQTALDGAGLTQAEANAFGASYTVISIQIGTSWRSLADADLTLAPDRRATCSADDIRFTVF